MRSAAACLIALTVLAAVPAAACTPPPGWPKKVKLDIIRVARTLVDAAATVDVVVAERVTDDYEVGTTPEANAEAMAVYNNDGDGLRLTAAQVSAQLKMDEAPDGARFHYRVLEHLKGAGSDTFSLNGMLDEPDGPGDLGVRRMNTTDQLLARLNSRDLADWQGFGSCIQPLWTRLGQRYVVFRDTNGRLLRRTVAVRLRGRPMEVLGPVYAETAPSGDDPWITAIRQVLTPTR